ncbi:hypothetical protein CLV74_102216 [Donghicola tyrosinivorans]|uniref:Uncharacterized protein n=1 Tax=Donghicola tyrosinivorans TaxID=1652492 RepID=A0A2T0X031_9RHOB|nr:hypothetical protein CLV74_102216 [Donghicola tyrosinivorans]
MRVAVFASVLFLSACVNYNAPEHAAGASQDEDFIQYPAGQQPTALSGIPIDAAPGPIGYVPQGYSASQDQIVTRTAFD